jgi:hypothetical protein
MAVAFMLFAPITVASEQFVVQKLKATRMLKKDYMDHAPTAKSSESLTCPEIIIAGSGNDLNARSATPDGLKICTTYRLRSCMTSHPLT